MTSISLFDTMDLPLQQMDFLDQTFDLSEGTLVADFQSNGGFLGLDDYLDGALKPRSLDPVTESLQDLLQPELSNDPLGDEWMEMVDLSSFLGDAAETTIPVDNGHVQVQEPLEKSTAFEFLKNLLLTGEKLIPESPEPQVAPKMPLLQQALLSNDNIFSFNTTDVASLESDIPLIVTEMDPSTIDLTTAVLTSPLSTDDIESLLSSVPSSPSDNSFHSMDGNSFSDCGCDDSYDGDGEWQPKEHSNSKKTKSRSSPYTTGKPTSNKRERKKEQNKNAATRYRVKKKTEKVTLHGEEEILATTNKGLKDKVESLQREITYMKDLMNEIYKAKSVKA